MFYVTAMTWRPRYRAVEAAAQELTATDLLAYSGRVLAFCPRCSIWRRVALDRLSPERRVVVEARRLRCVTCRSAPSDLDIVQGRHRITLRL
jgi:hypothetical protein